jgi:hypothetical protein
MKKIIILLALPLLFSCGKSEKIFFHTENNGNFEAGMLDNKFTVFCYIDSTDCSPCALQWLHKWKYFEEDLKKMKTGVALIVRGSDEDVVYSTLTNLRLNFPVVFDKSSSIKQDNATILDEHLVFAVNHKNEVFWLGLPIVNEASWDSFCKIVRRRSMINSLMFWQK